jgi:2-polyprenyl-6-methoxyphenol hydroxylase-like FAD-dependent oxidoreductase
VEWNSPPQASVSAGRTCKALRPHDANVRADIESHVWRTLEKVPDFLARVRQGQREETWTARQECRRYFGKPYGRGWALVGDAGYNRDPITAQGISDAFIDAEMLVEALSTFLSGDDTFELREIASAPGWQGYLSSAAKANARYGRAIEAWWVYRPDFAGRAREEPARTSEIPDPKPDNPDVRQVLERRSEQAGIRATT